MADRSKDRSPTFWLCQPSTSRENVARQSRTELSMEGSRLPTFRRSRSAASLTQHTLEVKQSTRGRSSSTSRNIQPKVLFHGSTQKNRSQRSGSTGASNKFMTPLNQQWAHRGSSSANRLTSSSKTSPWLKQDNKEAQIKEFSRIRQILASTNCNIELAKPVNLRNFVDILMHLFDVMQIDSNLTFGNYITGVPNLVKIIGYNGNCTTSFLKTLNTMHNWPHVLSMLSYLCNIIEAQYGTNKEFLVIYKTTKVKEVFRTTMFKLLQPDANKLEIMSDYVSETLKAKNVNVEEVRKAKEKNVKILSEIELLKNNMKEQQVDYEMRKTRTNELESNAEELKKRSEKIEAEHEIKMKRVKDAIQALEIQHAALIEKKALLEEQFKKQTYSKEDDFKLEEEKRDLEETCQLKEEQIKQIEADWNEVFLELSKVSGKLKAAAMSANAKLSGLSVSRPELKKMLMPEEGFSRYSKETFESMVTERLTALNTIHDYISDLKEQLRQSQAEYEKKMDVKKKLVHEISRLKAKYHHKLELQKRSNKKFDKKLEELDKELQDKRDATLSLIDKNNLLHAEDKEYTELAHKLDKKIVELEYIFEANRKGADQALTRTLLNIDKILTKFEENIHAKVQKEKERRKIYDECVAELSKL